MHVPPEKGWCCKRTGGHGNSECTLFLILWLCGILIIKRMYEPIPQASLKATLPVNLHLVLPSRLMAEEKRAQTLSRIGVYQQCQRRVRAKLCHDHTGFLPDTGHKNAPQGG